MSSDMIDYLMGQPDGANYVVLYQMLCLKTINTGGRLAFQIGDMIIPYDVEKIQRECKWFSLATVRVALEVYKQIGLIYEDKDGVLVLANYSDIVGSETDYSAQKRLQRENRRRQLPPKCADSNEDNNVDNVHTEKEIEITVVRPSMLGWLRSSALSRTISEVSHQQRGKTCWAGGRFLRTTSSCWPSKRPLWPGFANGPTSTAS